VTFPLSGRLLNLLSLSNVEFAREHIAFLLQTLPDPGLPRGQLLEVLLTEEFGEISEQLISLPSSEITKERNKWTRREKHPAAVADSCVVREAYAQSWPQAVPRDVVYGYLNAYYEGTQYENEASVPGRVVFSELPDPKGRDAMLKATQAYERYEMCIPPVFTDGGDIVVPSDCEGIVPDGTSVAMHGKMKM
jgi:hypothetical protein